MEICIAALLMAGTWLTWYIAHNRYHLTSGQIEELAAYAALILISSLDYPAPPPRERVASPTHGRVTEAGRAPQQTGVEP